MSILKLLSVFQGAGSREPAAPAGSVAAIAAALHRLEPAEARYLAAFAYLLGRVAHADRHVSPAETAEMRRLLVEHGSLPVEQAALVVEMAQHQQEIFGATEDFLVAREFGELADEGQKLALVHCLFAVSASDAAIGLVEENEIRRISRELKVEHARYIEIRQRFRQFLSVLQNPTDPGA